MRRHLTCILVCACGAIALLAAALLLVPVGRLRPSLPADTIVYVDQARHGLRVGRYHIKSTDNAIDIIKRLRRGQQEPIMLTVPSARTAEQVAGRLAKELRLDSASLAPELDLTLIPNTYEVYWTVEPKALGERLRRERELFWNADRRAKADSLGLTPDEVQTLASIIDEETANNAEKPLIARMYLNRLAIDMPLQADPTVKRAVGNWALRRILKEHLATESPYNTYLHTGLPPGPIRIASVAGIDAVLNAPRHSFLYMCAKEDFSGTHNFATTFAEHLANARRYQRALNERGIR